MTVIMVLITTLSGACGRLDTCKVISLCAESGEGSRWALRAPLPPQGLELTAVCDGQRQRNFPSRECGLLCLGNSSALHVPPLFPSFSGEGGGVFEEIAVFASQEMKRSQPCSDKEIHGPCS